VIPPGTLLRTARQKAGLSQAQLARQAGVTQSVISAYESGARQPSLPTIARLIEATGSSLEVLVHPASPARHPDGLFARRAREHRSEILAILRQSGLTNPRLFGSVARGEEADHSDIDLLVDVPAGVGLLTLARCQAELEALLDAPVDLIPAGDLKESVANEVLADAVDL
jgi:predicted nucleotidyltransferase/DNA-binding XRE family transcriptional regulator